MRELRLLTPADSRLKRENYHRTRHDPNFSKWKVLVGPSDWKDYYLGKEGATKYRLHNLPLNGLTGLYELGIASSESNLHSDSVLVAYIGQADDVRSRLQSYGRSGAHLGTKCGCGGGCKSISGTACEQSGPGLFDEIFRRGFSIVFRWAHMEDKRTAERTEAKLLDTFDYAWNKGANGSRRPQDVLVKIIKLPSVSKRTSMIKRILRFRKDGVGVKIESIDDSEGFLSAICKSLSSPFSHKAWMNVNTESNRICGMVIGNSAPCRRLPVPGRRRCEEHKGMRVCKALYKEQSNKELYTLDKLTCGVNLGNGALCTNPAVKGRLRCKNHKGLKVNIVVSKGKDIKDYASGKYPCEGSICNASAKETSTCEEVSDFKSSTAETVCSCSNNGSYQLRASAVDSSSCGSLVIPRNETSHQQYFMKVDDAPSRMARREQVNQYQGLDFCDNKAIGSGASEVSSSSVISAIRINVNVVCGATTFNGSPCRRRPAPGSNRCWQHKVMQDSQSSSITMDASIHEVSSPFAIPYVGNNVTAVCGATTIKGSSCKRQVASGNNKCWQHKDKN